MEVEEVKTPEANESAQEILASRIGFFPSDQQTQVLDKVLPKKEEEKKVEPIIAEEPKVVLTEEEKKELKKTDKPQPSSPFLEEIINRTTEDFIQVKTIEDLNNALLKEGYKPEEDGIAKFYEDYQKLKAVKEVTAQQLKESEMLAKFIGELPEEIYALVEAVANGKDYKEVFGSIQKKSALDLSKEFKEQNLGELLDLFFPDEFPNIREWEDIEGDNTFKYVVGKLEEEFNALKNVGVNKDVKSLTESQRLLEEKVKSTAEQSIAELKKSNPRFTDDDIKPIKEVMSGGPVKLFDRFFNADGSFKPTAATDIAKIEYFDKTVAALRERLSDSQKQLEEIVSRGGDRKSDTVRSADTQQTLKAKEMLDNLRKRIIPDPE